MLAELAETHQLLVTVEENAVAGGAGSAVNELLAAAGHGVRVLNLGLPDRFQDHAAHEEQLREAGLDLQGLLHAITRITRESALQVIKGSS